MTPIIVQPELMEGHEMEETAAQYNERLGRTDITEESIQAQVDEQRRGPKPKVSIKPYMKKRQAQGH
jgi:hypothetical protein